MKDLVLVIDIISAMALIGLIQSFYGLVVDLAERLGISADRPRHLQKVTRTR